MELAFQTSTLQFLHCVMQEVRTQEETAETIVPDSLPDIEAIADCSGVPILRGKDCRSGSVTVAGGVKSAILYIPEDGSYPRRLEVYIPFSMRFEHPDLTERARVLCSIRVCDMDARVINSRKAMVRAELACEITAYEQKEDLLYNLEGSLPNIQTKKADYQVRIPLEVAEKSFTVTDMLDVSNGHPPVSQIYKINCCPELTDRKLVGNKAVFKGILHCKFLYISENQELYLYRQQLPFSQYCELQTDYDLEEVDVYPVVTGYDLVPEGSETAQRVSLTVNLLAQALVSGTRSLSIVEDAYSTTGNFTPCWKQYDLECCLDQQSSVQTVRQHVSGNVREILDSDPYWGFPVYGRLNDQMSVSVPVRVRVLGYDDSGRLCSLRASGEAIQNFALSRDSDCRTMTMPVGDVLASTTADGAEVRCELSVHTNCYANRKLQTLCGATVEELSVMPRRPSVILRTVPGDTSIWDLAKTYGSTEEAIRIANQLDVERLSEDALLLLPIG